MTVTRVLLHNYIIETIYQIKFWPAARAQNGVVLFRPPHRTPLTTPTPILKRKPIMLGLKMFVMKFQMLNQTLFFQRNEHVRSYELLNARRLKLLEVGGTLTKFGDVLRSKSGQHIPNSVPSGGQI